MRYLEGAILGVGLLLLYAIGARHIAQQPDLTPEPPAVLRCVCP